MSIKQVKEEMKVFSEDGDIFRKMKNHCDVKMKAGEVVGTRTFRVL